jgi:ribosomal protein L37E
VSAPTIRVPCERCPSRPWSTRRSWCPDCGGLRWRPLRADERSAALACLEGVPLADLPGAMLVASAELAGDQDRAIHDRRDNQAHATGPTALLLGELGRLLRDLLAKEGRDAA